MRLKAFEAYGFKSFADKTEIVFDDGITAIIGPNGSGKSNISDAVRWVLGEQSVKYLRGNKMEDVIFSGSSKRRALGMAEVTLSFDNSGRELYPEFEEISICRRVFRSGDSEYYINKKACRLKDIIDLFADTGLGKGSMAIIGQNRIDEVLNSRPEDRRLLFEETAGIAKFRLRKKEAGRRLEETALNLTRIYDIKNETEHRLAPLRLAAEKAGEFFRLDGELQTYKLTRAVRRIKAIEGQSAGAKATMAELTGRNEKDLVALTLQENSVWQLKQGLDDLTEKFSVLQNTIAEKENRLEKLHGREAVLEERITQCNNICQRLQTARVKLYEQQKGLDVNLEEQAHKYDLLDAEQQTAAQTEAELKARQEREEQEITLMETQISDFKNNAFAKMQEIIDCRNAIRSLENEQELRQRKREQLKKSISDAEEENENYTGQQKQLYTERENISATLVQAKQDLAAMQAEGAELAEKLILLRKEKGELNHQLSATEARVKLLSNMQKEYEGFGKGVKTVLAADRAWREGILGVIGELIHSEDKFIPAIESALGGAVQYVVTAKSAVAEAAIAYLKETKAGRVTFLPLNTIKPPVLRAEDEALSKLKGVLGFADTFIQCAEPVRPAVRFLLGRVLIAENLASALQAAKQANYRLRIVTLEGDLINAGGSMTGGSRRGSEAGFLSRGKALAEAGQALGEYRKALLSLQETEEKYEEIQQNNKLKSDEINHLLQKNEIRVAELLTREEQLRKELSRVIDRLELFAQEKELLNKGYLEDREKLATVKDTLKALEDEDSRAKEYVDSLQKELNIKRNALSTTRMRYQNALVSWETAKERASGLAERISQIDADIVRNQEEIKQSEAEEAKTEATIEESKQQKTLAAAEKHNLVLELQKHHGGKEEYIAKRLAASEELSLAEERLRQEKQANQAIVQKMHALEIELAKFEAEYEAAGNELNNTFQISFAEADAKADHEIADATLKKCEAELTAKIIALGPINQGAVEEYEQVSQRHQFLTEQYGDLSQAKENLEEVIKELNSNMARKFRRALAEINGHFNEAYQTLFGGGSASLDLQDAENILESGVEITVQPPGKKLQSLYLLSGGERALTVIALLFGLLAYKPAPFCILDEIDAPLDDANIQRFSNFLHNYAARTQFIVITHRKGVMEAADVLHGITMQESGVSKLVSVKLEEREQA